MNVDKTSTESHTTATYDRPNANGNSAKPFHQLGVSVPSANYPNPGPSIIIDDDNHSPDSDFLMLTPKSPTGQSFSNSDPFIDHSQAQQNKPDTQPMFPLQYKFLEESEPVIASLPDEPLTHPVTSQAITNAEIKNQKVRKRKQEVHRLASQVNPHKTKQTDTTSSTSSSPTRYRIMHHGTTTRPSAHSPQPAMDTLNSQHSHGTPSSVTSESPHFIKIRIIG